MLLGDFLFSVVVGLVVAVIGIPITLGTLTASGFINKALGI